MMFVIFVAVVGCFVAVYGVAARNWWTTAVGVLIMPIAFRCRKIYKQKHDKS